MKYLSMCNEWLSCLDRRWRLYESPSKDLKDFKAIPLTTPKVMRLLRINNDQFQSHEHDWKISSISAVGALIGCWLCKC